MDDLVVMGPSNRGEWGDGAVLGEGAFGGPIVRDPIEQSLADELHTGVPDGRPHVHFHVHGDFGRHAHEHTHLSDPSHAHSSLTR